MRRQLIRITGSFFWGLVLTTAVVAAPQTSDVTQNPQNVDPPPHGWRRATQPPPAVETDDAQPAPAPSRPPESSAPAAPVPLDEFGQPRYAAPHSHGQFAPAPDIPERLTLKAGTYLTVRVDQPLSSDHNQPGDAFTATLVKPVVIDGVVVAQRGQTMAGTVVEAQKAGKVQGVSRLAVQLTELTLVDGQQLPLRTQLLSRTGPTSVGNDVGAVAATTATGAAIGAMAGWGTGAAIGAGAGAVAGLVGVLLTRGHETLIVPETMLTFRVEAPAAVVTARAPQAFRYVEPEDYGMAALDSRPGPHIQRQPMPAYYRPGFYYGPAVYPGYWGPGYWAPGVTVGVYFRPGYYWGPGYYRAHWH